MTRTNSRWLGKLKYVIKKSFTCDGSAEGPGEDCGGVYAVTLKPKKSWPNGRLRAAGTLTFDSIVLLETIRC